MNRNSKVKLIIADDSGNFLEGLKILFSTSDKYEVIASYSNGLDLIQSDSIGLADVIITDIRMPEMDGFQAAKKLNHLYNWIPIIALTMHKDELFLNEIVETGFKGFVYKPDAASQLIPVIEGVLSKKFMFPKDIKLK